MCLLWLRQLPWCGDSTPALVLPPSEGRPSPTNTPIFPLLPLSYQVLCGSVYYFLLVRCSCLLSAGVLQSLLCLKMYSWCIHGERCIPCPPTPPPSCPSRSRFFFPSVCAAEWYWGKNRMYSQVARLYTRLQNSGLAELRSECCPLPRLFFTTTTAVLVQQERGRVPSFDITTTN